MFTYGQKVTVDGFGPVEFEVADAEDAEKIEVFSAATGGYRWVDAETVHPVD